MAGLALAFDILARDKASKELNKVGDAAEKSGKKVGRFSNGVKAGAAVAGAAIVGFAKSSVSAFVEAEQSSARLDAALAKFPKTADVTRASFDDLNASLAKKTKFDDDATASGQAVLAGFNLTGKQIQAVTPLLQDYASKTGQDLPSAAQALGKAFGGNAKALKGIGINYKTTGDAGKDFTNIQELLSQKVGGFAEKEGKTAAGQAEILRNQFGEVQEELGAKLVPMLTKLADVLLKVIDFIQRNGKVIGPLVVVLGSFAAIVYTITKAVKAYTAVQAALNAVMLLNPIGLVVLALAGLVAGIVIAYKKSETFRTIIQDAFRFAAKAVIGSLDLILLGLEKLMGAAGKIPGPLGAPFRKAEEAIKSARGKLDGLSDKVDSFGKKKATATITLSGVGAAEDALLRLERRVTNIGGVQVAIPVRAPGTSGRAGGVQERALGGSFRAGQPYLVGERGPELVMPSRNGWVLNAKQTAERTSGGSSGLHIGQINVTSGPNEDASQSVPRTLRNLSFAMGV